MHGHLESCGDVTPAPLDRRHRKSSGVQGWRGGVGFAAAHCGALQGVQFYVDEDYGP